MIKFDEKLLGLILGFGKESSEAFKASKDEIPKLGRIAFRPKNCLITPVCFRGNEESEEVKKLVAQYNEEIQKIDQIYKSETFFIDTLKQYCAS